MGHHEVEQELGLPSANYAFLSARRSLPGGASERRGGRQTEQGEKRLRGGTLQSN